MANVPSSGTATGGQASNGMMVFKFHIPVKTERAVAVACSALVRHRVWKLIASDNLATPELLVNSQLSIEYQSNTKGSSPAASVERTTKPKLAPMPTQSKTQNGNDGKMSQAMGLCGVAATRNKPQSPPTGLVVYIKA